MANRQRGAFFHDIRWEADPADPENSKKKRVVPVEDWPTLQQAHDDPEGVIKMQVAVHQDKNDGSTYLRFYTEEFGSGQFSLFSMRMRPVKSPDGEIIPKAVIDRWVDTSGGQTSRGGQRQEREQNIDERLKAASTVNVGETAAKASAKARKTAKSSK